LTALTDGNDFRKSFAISIEITCHLILTFIIRVRIDVPHAHAGSNRKEASFSLEDYGPDLLLLERDQIKIQAKKGTSLRLGCDCRFIEQFYGLV
jgi:hypothetical protein